MTAEELRAIQKRLRLDAQSMARLLGEKPDTVPYETYRNYIYGANKVPDHIAEAATALEVEENRLAKLRLADGDAYADRLFPRGIISEVPDGW